MCLVFSHFILVESSNIHYMSPKISNLFALDRNISDVLWEAISNRQVLSLYQGLGTKNFQSFVSQFIYFYGYSFLKRLYLEKSGSKSIGTRANLIIGVAAGACTVVATQASIQSMV